ncbi:hypothetical protein GCM10010174_69860 [Kutzneria viridogrisea]
MAAYREATANAKRWTEIADRARKHITDALGDNEVGTVDGEPVARYTVVNGTRLDSKKLKAEHPDIVEQFTVPTTSRRFTLVDGA